ncbi:Uncharacterized protein HZ326_13802 [Fusarium oxysporum f. sp. albedinis]|nr:Uncharacterized protein HZ326_13802 [Fusarium oxysporum f. sp. albedinis]
MNLATGVHSPVKSLRRCDISSPASRVLSVFPAAETLRTIATATTSSFCKKSSFATQLPVHVDGYSRARRNRIATTMLHSII